MTTRRYTNLAFIAVSMMNNLLLNYQPRRHRHHHHPLVSHYRHHHLPILSVLLLLLLSHPLLLTNALHITTQIRDFSEIESNSLDHTPSTAPHCHFSSPQHITLAGPMSLKPSSRFFSTAQTQLHAMELVIDHVNSHRCGITINNENYPLRLVSYSDDSSLNVTRQIASHTIRVTSPHAADPYVPDGLLSSYSSALLPPWAARAKDTRKILISGGAAATGSFRDNPYAFGTLPPAENYVKESLADVLRHISSSSSSSNNDTSDDGTISILWEDDDFPRAACSDLHTSLPPRWTLSSRHSLPPSPTTRTLLPLARRLSRSNPHVVVACAYPSGCLAWMSSLRSVGWVPKMQILTICLGMDDVMDKWGEDGEFVVGVSPWEEEERGGGGAVDGATSWSGGEFAERFEGTTGVRPTYHAASAAAAVSVLIQAWERANSTDEEVVRGVLNEERGFETSFGLVRFDENGQNVGAKGRLVQYDETRGMVSLSGGYDELIYPMPTLQERDCRRYSSCLSLNGTCSREGSCQCPSLPGGDSSTTRPLSHGIGRNATCRPPPHEWHHLTLSSTAKCVGHTLGSFTILLCLLTLAGTWWKRNKPRMRTIRPFFLYVVAVGCFISTTAIWFMSDQTGYRYHNHNELNPDVGRVDRSCMAAPWLYGVGFMIVFGALFATVGATPYPRATAFTVETTLDYAPVTAEWKTSLYYIAVMLVLELVILISWQSVSPFRWERGVVASGDGDVLRAPDATVTLRTVGACTSSSGWYFHAAQLCLHSTCLLYALLVPLIRSITAPPPHLNHVPHHHHHVPPTKTPEKKYITFAITALLQILLLGVPITVVVMNDPNAYYITRVCIVVSQNVAVLVMVMTPIIFPNKSSNRSNAGRRSTSSRNTSDISRHVQHLTDANIDATFAMKEGAMMTYEERSFIHMRQRRCHSLSSLKIDRSKLYDWGVLVRERQPTMTTSHVTKEGTWIEEDVCMDEMYLQKDVFKINPDKSAPPPVEERDVAVKDNVTIGVQMIQRRRQQQQQHSTKSLPVNSTDLSSSSSPTIITAGATMTANAALVAPTTKGQIITSTTPTHNNTIRTHPPHATIVATTNLDNHRDHPNRRRKIYGSSSSSSLSSSSDASFHNSFVVNPTHKIIIKESHDDNCDDDWSYCDGDY